MRRTPAESKHAEWQVRSIFVRHRDGLRRVEQAFRLLLDTAASLAGATPIEGRTDHACGDLRSRLDRPPGA